MRRIVILGGGYAGVRVAQEILRHMDDGELVLIDRGHYHEIVTEMYRVAAGAEEPKGVQLPLRRLLPQKPQLTMLQAEVQSLDVREREVHTDRGRVPYRYLVLALGGAPEYYGVQGAKEYALTLQYLDSAVRVRRRLRSLTASKGGGRIVIVGGGLTGVELASEISEHTQGTFDIAIVQAAPTILPEEDKRLASYAQSELEKHHITVYRGVPVAEVHAHSVKLKSGADLPSDVTIWAGGVRANPIAKEAGLPCDQRGRVLVDAQLEVEGHPGIFAAGDIAHVPSGHSQGALPPTAQLAVQEGLQVGRNILRVLKDEEPQPLHARILGTAAALGDRHGIAHIGRFRLTGRAGHVMHELALLRYLYGAGGLGLLRREAYLSWTRPPQEHVAQSPSSKAGTSA
ncbi:MAG: FAD-dependent oxidoreductase [Thermaerobacter sp.]|nr:FAD-dependent oxidoreductase [Thermaerobacter sp.]